MSRPQQDNPVSPSTSRSIRADVGNPCAPFHQKLIVSGNVDQATLISQSQLSLTMIIDSHFSA